MFAYDLGRQLEDLPSYARRDVDTPDMSLGFYDWVLAYDHHTGTSWLVTTGLPDGGEASARARQAQVMEALSAWQARAAVRHDSPEQFRLTAPLVSNMTPDRYIAMVRQAQAYIAAGDIYQVNLSQRFASRVGRIAVGALSTPAAGESGAVWRLSRHMRPLGSVGIAGALPARAQRRRGDPAHQGYAAARTDARRGCRTG